VAVEFLWTTRYALVTAPGHQFSFPQFKIYSQTYRRVQNSALVAPGWNYGEAQQMTGLSALWVGRPATITRSISSRPTKNMIGPPEQRFHLQSRDVECMYRNSVFDAIV
jgi:hypothetical protein